MNPLVPLPWQVEKSCLILQQIIVKQFQYSTMFITATTQLFIWTPFVASSCFSQPSFQRFILLFFRNLRDLPFSLLPIIIWYYFPPLLFIHILKSNQYIEKKSYVKCHLFQATLFVGILHEGYKM